MRAIRRVISHFPHLQSELKRLHYARLIRRGRFVTEEPEYSLLSTLIKGGLVIDVGANVGHYCMRFSELADRVIAFEPVPTTFAHLAANARFFGRNVTLVNAALSDRTGFTGISVPAEDGLPNFYLANLSAEAELKVMTIRLDDLSLPKVSLLKIDVEGHEKEALAGMWETIQRDKPVIIIETGEDWVRNELTRRGYRCERLVGSPNLLCKP